jgi:Sulfotransferase family
VPADSTPIQSVFPFFVGSGRSGTTMFRATFDSHSRLAIPGESHLERFLRRRREYERGVFQTGVFIDDVLASRSIREGWSLSEENLRDCLANPAPRDMADAIRRMFVLYAQSAGKDLYGDKTPAHVLCLPKLATLFPESRFVHIIRDGRDVASSYLDAAWGPTSIEEAAIHWKRFVTRGRQDGPGLGSSRYIEVHYEDFLRDPVGTVRLLCDFIDLEFEETMLMYFERTANLISSSRYPHSHQHLKLPPTTGLRDWRNDMPRRDLEIFEAIAGDLIGELGYERALDRLPRSVRLDARRRCVRVDADRYARGVVLRMRRTAKRTRRIMASAIESKWYRS